MFFLRELTTRNNFELLLLLKLLLLALLLLLPSLNLILRVVCHDALFVNTHQPLALNAAAIAADAKETDAPTTPHSCMGTDETNRGDSCACTELVTTALASAKPMKRLVKIEAVTKKLRTRMTIPWDQRAHSLTRQPAAHVSGSWSVYACGYVALRLATKIPAPDGPVD
jgi:hypothetical protein